MTGIVCNLQSKGIAPSIPRASLARPLNSQNLVPANSIGARFARPASTSRFRCHAAAQVNAEQLKIDLSPYPEFNFFKVEAIIRPWRLSDVIHDLSANGILGMTATNVLGAGVQGGAKERYSGIEHGLGDLLEKSKLEISSGEHREQVNKVVRLITNAAKTGEVGDGKLFIQPVAEVVRIRTGEVGASAEHMGGGMTDSNILTSRDN